MQSFLAELLRI